MEHDCEDFFPPECGICSGPGEALGGLGSLSYFRCRGCGSTFTEEPAPPTSSE